MRRIIPIILALCVFASACASAPPSAYPEADRGAEGSPLDLSGVTRVAGNETYSLWVDADNAGFEVRGADGTVWKSRPDNAGDDQWVQDMLQKNVSSPLIVTVLDAEYAPHVIPSAEADVSYFAVPDGVRFSFRFARQRITVPLDVVLTGDGFTASVPPGRVAEDGGFLLNSIQMLPYFNSGSSDDDGFLFYPDGSGALSDYGKDYNNTNDVTQPVYGFDRGVGVIEAVNQAQGYRMPVFGAKTNGAAYLAVIEGAGSFISLIQTGAARANNRYFKNAAIFNYRDVGRVALRDNVSSVNTNYTIPAPVTATVPMTVRYLLLTGEETRYTDMAFAYRDYLEREGVLQYLGGPDWLPGHSLHLTLAGAIVKPSSFLGIPMEREITLTTFSQAGEILDALHDAGIGSVAARYTGAQKGGYNSRWTRDFKFNGALGGKKGFETLVGSYKEDTVFLNGELMQIYKTGRGFSVSRDAARTTGNGINFQYPYYLLDGTRDTDRRWYLLAPSLWDEVFGDFSQGRWRFEGFPLALEDAGMLVYSEYEQKNPLYRDVTGPMLAGALHSVSALDYGNAYTWGIAGTLYNVPLGASGYFIQSDEVPFYQLAVHGYIEYSGEPQNLSADKRFSFLRSVEYGALPHHFGIYAPSTDLNRSALAGMFSACYLDWLPDAAEQARMAEDIYKNIAGRRIIDHFTVSDGVYTTVYENKYAVTVDYNSTTLKAGWQD